MEEELYYPCSKNKGVDQLCSDLHILFSHMQKSNFFHDVVRYLFQGKTIQRKIELHKLCEANKAYAHFRWT